MRILIVDDTEELRLVIAAVLQPLGFALTAVASAHAALAELARGDVALILSDLEMPGMSGIELAHAVAARDDAPPMILISAHPALAVLATECAAVRAAIPKPFDARALRAAVRLVLADPAPARQRERPDAPPAP